MKKYSKEEIQNQLQNILSKHSSTQSHVESVESEFYNIFEMNTKVLNLVVSTTIQARVDYQNITYKVVMFVSKSELDILVRVKPLMVKDILMKSLSLKMPQSHKLN
jgi:hypothetical protein